MLRNPPDILITTPESLFLLLTSRARETLRTVRFVIVDEVHAVAGTKRGAHLALSLERLERLTAEPVQRIGLSATQRPLEEIGRFVSGGRDIELVDAGRAKELDLRVVVPLEDMREPGEGNSIWPSIYPALLELVESHRSTIVFVNNRRLAERLALRLNELAEREIARAHHGSLAREQRVEVEELLKRGEIPGLVATSSLELGIDMGAVDLVVQVESPKSVARGLQRVGRAGHRLDEPSKGRIFPKFRADLLESAVVAQRMREGADRGDARAAQPARRPGAADRRRRRRRGDRGRRAARPRAPRLAVPRPLAQAARERPRHARGPLPVRGVRRAPPAHHLGSRARLRARPRGRAPARRHERRHDPGPRALRRLPRRGRRARRGARRGDGLRGPRRPDVPPRRLDVADRGDHPRPRARLAGPGRPRPCAVLEGRGRRPPVRARRGDRAHRAGARRPRRRAGPRAADRRARARRARRAEPAHLPPRARGGDARDPVGPHDRRRALPRRDRRLAPVHPHALRRPRPRALVARARGPPARVARARGERDLVGRRHRAPPAGRGCASALDDVLVDPDELEELVVAELARDGALRRALPRERRARPPHPAATAGPADAALAAAAQGAGAPAGRPPLLRLPGRARDLPRVPAGRLRPAGAARAPRRSAAAPDRPRRGRDADRLAVRLVAPLRLRRHVHVRGRHAARRAPRPGARARPRPAQGAARPGGASRPDRPGGARAGRGGAARLAEEPGPAPRSPAPPRRPPPASTTPRSPSRSRPSAARCRSASAERRG